MNNTTPLPDSMPAIDMRAWIMVLTMCVVAAVALVEHFTILLLTCVNKSLRQKPYIVAILMLSTSDMFLSFALVLLSLISLVPLRQTMFCGSAHFFVQLGFLTSLVQTLSICIERYLCTRPMPMTPFSLRKRQLLALISIGACSLILGIPYLFVVREPTIDTCTAHALFVENLAFARFPSRLLTFVVWLSTVLVFSITVKQFRNSTRIIDRLQDSHRGRHNLIPTVINDLPNAPTLQENTFSSSNGPCHSRSTTTDEVTGIIEENQQRSDGVTSKVRVQAGEIDFESAKLGKVTKRMPMQPRGHIKVFKIITVVFVCFFVTMTPQAIVGLIMVFHPMSDAVEFVCASLAFSSILTNPVMFALLLKDFRRVVFTCR